MVRKDSPSRLVRNAFSNWTAFLFSTVVSFFLSPFVVNSLGATGFAVWSLAAGLISYLILLDLGIRQAVNRYVAHHEARGAHADTSSVVSAAFKLFGLLGLLAIGMSAVLAYLAPFLFNIPQEFLPDTRLIVVLGGLTVAVSLVSGVFGGAITGVERFDVQCGIEMLLTSIRSIGIVVALNEGHGIVAMASIQLATSLVGWLANWLAVRKLLPELRIRLSGALLAQMKTLLSFGASLSVLYVFSQIAFYGANVIIPAFLPIEALAYYAIAGNLVLQASGAGIALSNIATPRVSALMSTGSDQVPAQILAVARIASVAAAPIAATLWLRGESFITLWMGSAYGPASGEVLRILAVLVLLTGLRYVAMQSLVGMGRQRSLIAGFAAETVLMLAMSTVLVRPLGIVGVAVGAVIPSLLLNLGYIPRCLSSVAKVPVKLYYRDALLLPVAACVPFSLASIAFEQQLPATSLAVFFGQVFATLPLVPLAAWFLCLSKAERVRVRFELRRIIGR